MARRVPDERQIEMLFGPPAAPQAMGGSLNISLQLRHALTQAIKDSPYSRAEIATAMTELVFGEGGAGEITIAQINAWTAPTKADWRFPLEYLPAFVQATGGVWLVDWLAQKCGCRALRGEQAVLVEMSAKEVLRRKAEAEAKRLGKEVETLKSRVTPELLEGLNGREIGK